MVPIYAAEFTLVKEKIKSLRGYVKENRKCGENGVHGERLALPEPLSQSQRQRPRTRAENSYIHTPAENYFYSMHK